MKYWFIGNSTFSFPNFFIFFLFIYFLFGICWNNKIAKYNPSQVFGFKFTHMSIIKKNVFWENGKQKKKNPQKQAYAYMYIQMWKWYLNRQTAKKFMHFNSRTKTTYIILFSKRLTFLYGPIDTT